MDEEVDAERDVHRASSAALTSATLVRLAGYVGAGNAGIPGVMVTLTGSQSASTYTDLNGNYQFLVPAGSSTSVNVSMPGATFTTLDNFNLNNVQGDEFVRYSCASGCAVPSPPLCETGTSASDCREALAFDPSRPGSRLAFYRDRPLVSWGPDLKHAIIVLHGHGGDAGATFGAVKAALGPRKDTIVIAPYLGGSSSHSAQWPTGCTSCLSFEDWASGGKDASNVTDSFTQLEWLAERLRSTYPLESVTFVGFSEGGQAVQRFAAMSKGFPGAATHAGLQVRFVVASPSSYVYLDSARLERDDDLCPDEEGRCDVRGNFSTDDIRCNGKYNEYKHGLTNLPAHLEARLSGLANTADRYLENDVTYLVNTGDACADPYTDPDMDETSPPADLCRDLVQGPRGSSYRMQRGLVYFNYLEYISQQWSKSIDSHRLYIVDGAQSGCGHDSACMYGSQIGRDVLLGNPVSPAFDPATTNTIGDYTGAATCK
ncbi:hypothetical protein WME99_23515 [Sorangium sp. So ce136]|uniref:hypothetical protein n=1 Tax=Sorangium sp. So ce136 TaxID=3133284 RepID=UPI003EFF8CAC